MGQTSNPNIPQATSILDYVAQYLDFKFKLFLPREASTA